MTGIKLHSWDLQSRIKWFFRIARANIKQVLKVGCFLHSFICKKAWELYENRTNFWKKPPCKLFAERPSQKPIVKDIYRLSRVWAGIILCGGAARWGAADWGDRLRGCRLGGDRKGRGYWAGAVSGVAVTLFLRANAYETLNSCDPPLYCWNLENERS